MELHLVRTTFSLFSSLLLATGAYTLAPVVVTSEWTLNDTTGQSSLLAFSTAGRSKMDCAAMCLMRPHCSMFAFKTTSSTCLLEDRDGGSSGDVSNQSLHSFGESWTKLTKEIPAGSWCPNSPLQFYYNATYNTCIYATWVNSPKLTWAQSKLKCEDLGGHLYDILTNDKFEALKDYFGKLGQDPWAQWIGASDEVTEGSFVWMDGTDANSMLSDKWEGLNPDNWGTVGEDYVQLNGYNWDFNDRSANQVAEGYICEIDE